MRIDDASLNKDSKITGFALCVFIVLSMMSGLFRTRLAGLMNETAEGLTVILIQMLALVIPYCIIRKLLPERHEVCMLTADERESLMPVFLAVFFLYFTSNLISAALFRSAGIDTAESTELPSGKTALILFFLSYTLLSAVLEELFFRRGILGILKPYGKWASLSISSLIFAVSHWEAVRVIPVFVFSFFLGLAYLETDKLIYPILIHTLNNLLAFANIWITESGKPGAGASVMIAAAIIGFVCLVVLVVILPLGRIFASEPEEDRVNASQFFTWPVMTAAAAYIIILIRSCGVF